MRGVRSGTENNPTPSGTRRYSDSIRSFVLFAPVITRNRNTHTYTDGSTEVTNLAAIPDTYPARILEGRGDILSRIGNRSLFASLLYVVLIWPTPW